jgi:hypothetical protein
VPGGGLSPDGKRWIACKPSFFLPVRVLSRLFRRLFLQGLEAMHAAGKLQLFTDLRALKDADEFRAYLAPLRTTEWVVYAKKPLVPDPVGAGFVDSLARPGGNATGSCKRAGKTRTLMPVWDSSGASRLI